MLYDTFYMKILYDFRFYTLKAREKQMKIKRKKRRYRNI